MLDIQALKFARMFRKQMNLVLTKEAQLQFEANLLDGLEQALRRGEDTSPFEEARNSYRDALAEGRIVVVGG